MEEKNVKLSFKKWDVANADDRRKPILDGIVQNFGMVPNMYANMIGSPGLLETYLYGYEIFRKESGFTPVEQEVIFLTLSYENNCDYCMSAHSFIADRMSKVPADVTNAIRAGVEIEDFKLRELSAFTSEMFLTRGRPSATAVDSFFNVGYDERKVLEIILALAVKTLSNYSNHISDPELDGMFAERIWKKGE